MESSPPRRSFLIQAVTACISVFVGIVPFASGLVVWLDPLLRRRAIGGKPPALRLGAVDLLPEDGTPQMFPIKADRVDAWTKYSKLPIGAVYVRRKPDGGVQAFNATCPHLGCFVNAAGDGFRCPCHDSRFKLDGERLNPETCPSPRNLDELEVDQEKLAKGELWVRYQAFESGKSEKIPKA